MDAARTRNGFTLASREQLFRKFRGLEISECVRKPSRGALTPMGPRTHRGKDEGVPLATRHLVANFEFVGWTPDGHLRRSKFVRLREDTNPRKVIRES